MEHLPAGHEIGGYRIVRVAGSGAVGVVYEARHVTLGKRVAVKTLNRVFAKEPEFRARFDREAQGAASVDHPNITAVIDSGEQDGLPYLVMTYVDGPDLERILETRDEPLEPAEALLVCASVAQALDAAAAIGLAHRDVKPANILLQGWAREGSSGLPKRPHVYLTDFGLTKHNAAATVTRTGQFVGTLLYMAPEQIEGHAIPASDQYSLACVLWECIVGTPPFLPSGGSNLSLLTAHLSDPIPLISERSKGRFSRELDKVFLKGMAKKASDRYDTCTEFTDAASAVLGLAAKGETQPRRSTPGGSPDADDEPKEAPKSVWVGPRPKAKPAKPPEPETRPDPQPTTPPPADTGRTTTFTPGSTPAPPPGPVPTPTPTQPAHPTGFGHGGPSGLPPGLAPNQYQPAQQRGSGRGVLIGVVVVVLLAAVGLVVWLATSSGGNETSTTPTEQPSDVAGTDPTEATPTPSDVATTPAVDPTTPVDAPPPGVPLAQQGRIAFVGDGQVWVAGPDGARPTAVAALPGPGNGQPAWQPGGSSLAVSQGGSLVLIDPATGTSQTLTEGPGHTDPVWYPDGQRLLFSAPRPDGGRDLAVADLEGTITPLGLADRIDSGGQATVISRPAVSPVDEAIAFHANGPDGLDIWVLRPDDQLTLAAGEPGVSDFHPAFAPNGALVYSSARSGTDEVYRRQAGEAGDTLVVGPPAVAAAKDADVSPCGDYVAFQVDDADGSRIAIAPLDGGATADAVTFLPNPAGVASVTDPAWSGQACA